MNKKTKILGALAWSILIGFSSCKKDDPGPGDGNSQKYLVQTMSEIAQVKPGHTAAYSEFPTGTINNSAQTGALGASGNEGFRTYNGMVFKMFNGSFERGIYRLLVDGTGRVSYDTKSIKTSNSHSGSGNFVIENDTKGYYWDGDSPWEIHTFNPTALERTGSLGNYEAELKKSDAGINFQAIGQHFLAIKEGKLYADVTYSEGSEQRGGVFNDFFPDVTIAVIDLQTGDLEKTTVIKNTGAIAFINDNEMYSFDQQGNLYIVCQGTNAAFGTNSKIARIKKGETDIDATWELKFSDYRSADDGKFVGVFAEGDRLVLTVNTEPLTADIINNGEIWKFYSVDIATKQFTPIEGVEASINGGGAYPAFSVDGKTILLVNKPSQSDVSGYYELNGNTVTPLFKVTGGHPKGFTKINVTN